MDTETLTKTKTKTTTKATTTTATGSWTDPSAEARARDCRASTVRARTTDHTAVVLSAREGDPDAWAALVSEYSGMLGATARRYRLNDAQAADAVQMTWLRLLENFDDLRDPDRLAGWLATTARRICLQAVQDPDRPRSVDEAYGSHDPASRAAAEGVDDGPEPAVLRSEQVALLRQVLAELPEHQRRLMYLLMSPPVPSYRDIAAQLDMRVGSVGPTRARILAKMRARLAALGLDDLALS